MDCGSQCREQCPYKVDGPKAAVSNLVQVTEDILRVIFKEEVS